MLNPHPPSVYTGGIVNINGVLPMSRSTWLIAAILAVSFLLSACGQKGELYLPDEDKQEQKKRY